MLDQATRAKIVSDLFETYQTRKGLPLLSKSYPGIEVEDAYRIQEAFVAQQAANPLVRKGQCCPSPLPVVPAYSGGNSSNGLMGSQIRNQQLCDASQTLAVLLLQNTNSTTKLLTTPGTSARFSPAVRFQQYTRRANPVPCPPTVGNPAIPTSPLGPCTNVIGIVQTWPPP